MVRTVIGGLVGGFVIYLVGFIFWGTPLGGMAVASVTDAQSAAVQTSLAQNLTERGTGTYVIPSPGTAEGTTLYGQGPIAVVHFNTNGYPATDVNSLVVGLILALLVGILIAFALAAVRGGFAARARVAVLYALAITVWTILAQPVFNHYGWGYWIYAFIADLIALSLAGIVIARWFLRDGVAAEGVRAEA